MYICMYLKAKKKLSIWNRSWNWKWYPTIVSHSSTSSPFACVASDLFKVQSHRLEKLWTLSVSLSLSISICIYVSISALTQSIKFNFKTQSVLSHHSPSTGHSTSFLNSPLSKNIILLSSLTLKGEKKKGTLK